MDAIHEIKYDGKTYNVYEPTLDVWQQLILHQQFDDDFELAVHLLSWVTGLTTEDIAEADARSIINAADGLVEYYVNQSEKFHETFNFAGKNYKFIDLPNLTFGEYVDIDDILQKGDSERTKNLNLLMALLYREIDEKGNYLPYDINRIKKTAEDFKQLPIKYLKGASVFFYLIETTLLENTRFYIHQKIWWQLRKRMIQKRIKEIGGGIQSSYRSLEKTFYTWKRSLKKTMLKS
jgi:hypothetical protein